MKRLDMYQMFVDNCGLSRKKYDEGKLLNCKTNETISFKEAITSIGNFLYETDKIEDELGIEIPKYIRLVQEGFVGYVEDDDHEEPYLFEFEPHDFVAGKDGITVYWQGSDEEYKTYRYEDYGKTWALTKGELS